MNFDYFYNRQSEMYNFIRLPMVLMEDKIFESISIEAKGNMGDVFGSGNGELGEIVDNPNFGNPGLVLIQLLQKLFLMKQKNI